MSNASADTASTASAGRPDTGASGRAAAVAAAIAVAIVVALVVAHAVKGSPKAAASSSGHSSMSMPSTTSSSAGSAAMSAPSGMPAGHARTSTVETVRGVSLPVMSSSMPMPMTMVPLGEAVWDGMAIQARTSAPATFYLFDGTSQRLVKPTAKDSFHLMVTLSDSESNYAIPYSSVWATIRKNGKIVFDERLWPMISRYMGPHYGDNVALPTAGLYHLTLLVSPPAAARHLEYKGLWLKPHRVNLTFRWVPRTT